MTQTGEFNSMRYS